MIRFLTLLTIFFSSLIAGCSKQFTAKLVFHPRMPVQFGSMIYFNGDQVGEVVNLEVDVNYCYAVVEFKNASDATLFQNYDIGQDNLKRLALVKKSKESQGFKWQ